MMRTQWLKFGQTAAVSLVVVGIAAVARSLIFVLFGEVVPYTTFYPAIVAATMYGRLAGGFMATAMAALAASFWLSPFGRLMIEEINDLVGLLLFVGVSGLIVALCEAMRKAQHLAEVTVEQRERALAREQAARREAEEANRLKDVFLASVSHELRTPLQAILGWTQLLSIPDCSAEDRAEGLEVIERNVRAQARLIEDLLDMSRIIAGKMRLSPRLIDPQDAIEAAIQTVSLAAQAKNITIDRQYGEPPCRLRADPDRLQQIVWNLLSNSIKFSPPDSRICLSLQAKNKQVQIQVQDEGEGIEPELLKSVFEPFCQAHSSQSRGHGGLGLGLSIVKHLTELHGGEVRAESRGRGQGTTMTLLLPALDPHDEALHVSPRPAVCELKGVRVLVVDDDAATCELVRRILQERQAEVEVATGMDDALAAVDRFRPKILVSDIGMPGGDGYELLRRIRLRWGKRQHWLGTVALTAYASPDDQRRAMDAGFHLHLAKPVEAEALTEAVAELASLGEGRHYSQAAQFGPT